MEEMYFAWLENPQSVHKVGTCVLHLMEGKLLGGWQGGGGTAEKQPRSQSLCICVGEKGEASGFLADETLVGGGPT